jgi:hypothetical protein
VPGTDPTHPTSVADIYRAIPRCTVRNLALDQLVAAIASMCAEPSDAAR